MRKPLSVFAISCLAVLAAAGQNTPSAPPTGPAVSRTTKAVNYRLRSGAVTLLC